MTFLKPPLMRFFIQLFSFFLFTTSFCPAQNTFTAHLNLGFNAKMHHLSALATVKKVKKEPEVKKSTRTLSEILAKSKKTDVDTAYHLIAGCFSSLINAERLVNQLINDSYTASVVGKEDDLYFVAFKSYQTYNDALKCLAEFKTKGIDSWVKKM
jgi:hypothetical protein